MKRVTSVQYYTLYVPLILQWTIGVNEPVSTENAFQLFQLHHIECSLQNEWVSSIANMNYKSGLYVKKVVTLAILDSHVQELTTFRQLSTNCSKWNEKQSNSCCCKIHICTTLLSAQRYRRKACTPYHIKCVFRNMWAHHIISVSSSDKNKVNY